VAKLMDKFKELMATGGIEEAEVLEKMLPDLESELDELDVITADGLDRDDADEILGDVLPDVMKIARKHTKGRSVDEIENVVYNFIIVLKMHYKWDIWLVPEVIERAAIRKIVSIVFKAVSKDQLDPETDSSTLNPEGDENEQPQPDSE